MKIGQILFFSILWSIGNCKKQKNNDNSFLALLIGGRANGASVESLVFSPAAGNQTANSNITISTTTPGVNIYYTTNGNNPISNSTEYTSPIVNIRLVAGKTIQAIAVKPGLSISEILTGVFSLQPAKTQQTTVYQIGDNGTNQTGLTGGLIDNGNGTVSDSATGLIWQKCSRGQNNDGSCSGTASIDTVYNGVSYCSSLNLASRTWRLPSRQELVNLIDYGKASFPPINSTYFPGTPSDTAYWTSTTFAGASFHNWFVDYSNGNSSADVYERDFYIRCVSGESREYSNNFTDNTDGTVKDKNTGLIWQKCINGQNSTTCSGTETSITWTNAISYCNGLNLASRTWRLPNIKELESIVDTTKASGASIDTSVFVSTVANSFWSSTTNASNTSAAWYFSFSNGNLGHGSKTWSLYSRCVSGP